MHALEPIGDPLFASGTSDGGLIPSETLIPVNPPPPSYAPYIDYIHDGVIIWGVGQVG